MKIFTIVSLLIVGCSTILARKWPEKNGQPCACNRLHDPVCGSDGQDYPNGACARSCGKVRSFRRGYCDAPALCGCTFDISTVCATRPDGTLDEFDNRCQAECENGARVVNDGPCASKPVQSLPGSLADQLRDLRSLSEARESRSRICKCPYSYDPVCGLKNGVWKGYGNRCAADCDGVETTKSGRCDRPCVCTLNYRPVCARKTDGTLKDYSNECVAACEDAVRVNDGRCQAKPERPGRPIPRILTEQLRELRSIDEEKAKKDQVCACPYNYSPVCGLKDRIWRDFPNQCTADCAGVQQTRPGVCRKPCVCTRHYRLVCARKTDGTLREYSNECMAACEDAAIVNDGACLAKPVQPLPGILAEELRELRSVDEEKAKKDQVCACPYNYSPVCGLKDRIWRDFPNQCSADCAGVQQTRPGVCRKPCVCTRHYRLVCARKTDGTLREYSNACMATCEDASIVNDGPCLAKPVQPLPGILAEQLRELRSVDEEKVKKDQVCACPAIYSPVCGRKNGAWNDYSSSCAAKCDGVEEYGDGLCRPCVCTRIYRPVCARQTDGTVREFGNECSAQCAGAVIVNSGRCQVRPDNSLPHHEKKSEAPLCVCPQNYSPVCGEVDGNKGDYSNGCVAKCHGATNIKEGKCFQAEQLPVFPSGPNEGSDMVFTQTFITDDSNDADDSVDSDLVAAQLPHFPNLFKKIFQF